MSFETPLNSWELNELKKWHTKAKKDIWERLNKNPNADIEDLREPLRKYHQAMSVKIGTEQYKKERNKQIALKQREDKKERALPCLTRFVDGETWTQIAKDYGMTPVQIKRTVDDLCWDTFKSIEYDEETDGPLPYPHILSREGFRVYLRFLTERVPHD